MIYLGNRMVPRFCSWFDWVFIGIGMVSYPRVPISVPASSASMALMVSAVFMFFVAQVFSQAEVLWVVL